MSDEPRETNSGMIPLFPLPDCVLLPGVLLPLHVFEPRYRAMVADVLSHDAEEQLIAVGWLREGHVELYTTKLAPIHPVVCVGRVMEFEALPDGRYNLMFLGWHRARIIEEDRSEVYRQVDLDAIVTEIDVAEADLFDAREKIRTHLETLKRALPVGLTMFETMFKEGASLARVIDALAFHLLPRDHCALKQRILEEPSLSIRVGVLLRWLGDTAQAYQRGDRPGGNYPPPVHLN